MKDSRLTFLLRWMLLALVLNLIWEIAQLPLYAIYEEGDRWTIAYAVGHCTIGDLMITLACYLLSAAVLRDLAWPVHRHGAGIGIALGAGLAYTAFSEWLNVSVRGSWAYTSSMPQVFGVGVSPLLQWLVVPLVVYYLIRVPLGRASGN